MKATVLWPGKDWDDKFNPGKKKTQAKFIIDGNEEVAVNASNPNSDKAMFLKSLKKGDTVLLSKEKYHKDGEVIEYWDIDTWALIGALKGGSGGADGGGKEGFMEAFAASRKRAKWFQQQGIELAHEVFVEWRMKEDNLGRDDALASAQDFVGEIFERGGALGTSMHMDLIAKGFR